MQTSAASSSRHELPLKLWLQRIGCLQYYSSFVDNNITLDLLPELDDDALKEIGVNKVGDRLRIELEIARSNTQRLMSGPVVSQLLEDLCSRIDKSGNFVNAPLSGVASSPTTDSGVPSPHSPSTAKKPLSDTGTGHKDSSKYVSFILTDGSIKRVNVTGCFNGPSIKRKVMRKLGLKQSEENSFDTYTYSPPLNSRGELSNPTHFGVGPDRAIVGIKILSDVELVTVCYSSDRFEKHRIILCSKNQRPSKAAIETSVRMMIKHGKSAGELNYNDQEPSSEAEAARMRGFFGQRPPSELISSNLAEYFPHAQQKQLEATVRNSVRFSVRLSRHSSQQNSSFSRDNDFESLGGRVRGTPSILSSSDRHSKRLHGRTIGDVMISNVAAIDEAVTSGDAVSDRGGAHGAPSLRTSISRTLDASRHAVSLATTAPLNTGTETASHRYSRIELLSVTSDSEDEDEKGSQIQRHGIANTQHTLEESHNETFESESGLLASLDLLTDTDGHINWLKGARIGAGTFGVVYLGMSPTTGELMAVKQIPLPTQDSSSEMHQLMVDQQREMHLLKELDHENIVRYFGASTSDGCFNIFLEYVPGGSVLSMLTSYGPFEEPLIRNFVRQVLIGLSYLHGENIIHRDIKGANILIDIKGTVKIGDFGISKRVDAGDEEEQADQHLQRTRRRASLQGLVFWMAPEVVKQIAYTKKADIWLMGALIVEMFTGSHPFPQLNHMQAIFKLGTLVTPEIPEQCTAEATDFLGKTFEIDYEKRPDAVTLLSDTFLNPLILSRTDR